MLKKLFYFTLLAFCLTSCPLLNAEPSKASQNKSASSDQDAKVSKAIDKLCRLEQGIAMAALQLRDEGKSKAEVLKPLPDPSSAEGKSDLGLAMHSVVEDIFAYPKVKSFPYFIYRSELCFRRYEKKPIPSSFKAVAKDVLGCQKKHGSESSDPLINCVRAAIIKGSQ